MAKRQKKETVLNSDGCYLFRNEEVLENFIPKLHEIKRNKKLCDFEIKVGDRSISAHRVVLAASIPYFYKMFCEEGNEKKVELVLQEMDLSVIEKIVEYSYRGEIEIDSENLEKFMFYAVFFELPDIWQACAHFMAENLNVENVFKYKNIAESVKCESLIAAANSFICQHFSQVQTAEFLKLSFEDLGKLIEKDDLNVTKEEHVYEAVMRWVKFDQNQRKALLPEIFKKIRLTSISIPYLFREISTEKLIKESLECCNILDEVKLYQILKRKNLSVQLSNSQPRYSVKANSESIYAICGSNMGNTLDNSILVYKENKWTKLTYLFKGKEYFQAVNLNGKVYIIGGKVDKEYSTAVEIFDIRTNGWSKGKQLKEKNRKFGVAALDGNKIYMCGGIQNSLRTSSVQCFSVVDNEWADVAPMKFARSSAGVVSSNGLVYVVGGYCGISPLNICEKYCPATNEWSTLAPMRVPRKLFGIAELNGKIYACGGHGSFDQYLNVCEVYDPETNNWSFIAYLQEPRSNFSLVRCNRKLYAIGGYNKDGVLSSIEEYCPETNQWQKRAPLPDVACDVIAIGVSRFDYI